MRASYIQIAIFTISATQEKWHIGSQELMWLQPYLTCCDVFQTHFVNSCTFTNHWVPPDTNQKLNYTYLYDINRDIVSEMLAARTPCWGVRRDRSKNEKNTNEKGHIECLANSFCFCKQVASLWHGKNMPGLASISCWLYSLSDTCAEETCGCKINNILTSLYLFHHIFWL